MLLVCQEGAVLTHSGGVHRAQVLPGMLTSCSHSCLWFLRKMHRSERFVPPFSSSPGRCEVHVTMNHDPQRPLLILVTDFLETESKVSAGFGLPREEGGCLQEMSRDQEIPPPRQCRACRTRQNSTGDPCRGKKLHRLISACDEAVVTTQTHNSLERKNQCLEQMGREETATLKVFLSSPLTATFSGASNYG